MNSEIVTLASQPMLFVSRSSSMDQGEIARVMNEGFAAMGAFIGRNGIMPLGPPLCIYRTWGDNHLEYEIGFPVPKEALAKAGGEVKSGATPAGKAQKYVHVGPYSDLRDVYAAIQTELMAKGAQGPPPLTWEVYVSDPQTTAEKDLVTEIYMAAES